MSGRSQVGQNVGLLEAPAPLGGSICPDSLFIPVSLALSTVSAQTKKDAHATWKEGSRAGSWARRLQVHTKLRRARWKWSRAFSG